MTNQTPSKILLADVNGVISIGQSNHPRIHHFELGKLLSYENEDEVVRSAQSFTSTIFEIWRILIGSSDFNLTDDLAELGVDSLSVMQFSARFDQLTGIRIPVTKIGEHPTVAQLVRYALKHVPGTVAVIR